MSKALSRLRLFVFCIAASFLLHFLYASCKSTTFESTFEATPENESTTPRVQEIVQEALSGRSREPAKHVPHFIYREAFAGYVKRGRAVEIGTFDGDFAVSNLQLYEGEYFMVDVEVRPKLERRLETWKRSRNVFFLHQSSAKAAEKFEDLTLDWIYVDAGHSYEAVLKDMRMWWPKLKPGGLFSGHDYCVSQKELSVYPDMPWCGVYGPSAKDIQSGRLGLEKKSQLGSARAVQHFAHEINAKIYFTSEGVENDEDYPARNPSWYFIKAFS